MNNQTENKINGHSDGFIANGLNFLNKNSGAVSFLSMMIFGAIALIGDFAIVNYRMKRTPDKVEQHDDKILALADGIINVRTDIIDLKEKLMIEFNDMQSDVSSMQSDFGSMQSDVSSMQSDVSSMQSDVSSMQEKFEKMKLRLDIFSDNLVSSDKLGEKHSPMRLNEAGKQVYQAINGEQFLQRNMDLLMQNIKSIDPRTPIEVQISAKDVIIDLIRTPIFNDINNIVYNSPEIEINVNGIKSNYQISILDACFVLSIPLRDKYLAANPDILAAAQTK